LRGSGRFKPTQWTRTRASSSFNPLHCGAVVASRRAGGARLPRGDVSIPFIAGQWSLRKVLDLSIRLSMVSIPFIAGQWSLLDDSALIGDILLSFNPLHCGAVVASFIVDISLRVVGVFQSPSLRGSGRFSVLPTAKAIYFAKFQSPSLRGSGRF